MSVLRALMNVITFVVTPLARTLAAVSTAMSLIVMMTSAAMVGHLCVVPLNEK